MNYKKDSKKKILFLVLLLFLLWIVFFFFIRILFPAKKVESFDLGGSISSGFNDVGNSIKGAGNSVGGGVTDMTNQIKRTVDSEIRNLVVKPFTSLFKGIGNIFVQLFGVLQAIADKIASLPSCMPFYLVDSMIASILGFIKYVVPGFIYDFFSNLYSWTLGIFVNWFLDLIGWTAADKKCYDFDVNSQISQMSRDAQDIGSSFASAF